MQLNDLIGKSCLIGLSYFDDRGGLIKQSQLAGTVTKADPENGISVELQSTREDIQLQQEKKPAIFILPPSLSCWFIAPQMHFQSDAHHIDIIDPDYLVTWDIHQTKESSAEGEHEWWDWVPRSVPPQVG